MASTARGIRIGLIGEIGVSSDFTADEEKSLRGAAQAQRRTGLAADGASARLVPPWRTACSTWSRRRAATCGRRCSAT